MPRASHTSGEQLKAHIMGFLPGLTPGLWREGNRSAQQASQSWGAPGELTDCVHPIVQTPLMDVTNKARVLWRWWWGEEGLVWSDLGFFGERKLLTR